MNKPGNRTRLARGSPRLVLVHHANKNGKRNLLAAFPTVADSSRNSSWLIALIGMIARSVVTLALMESMLFQLGNPILILGNIAVFGGGAIGLGIALWGRRKSPLVVRIFGGPQRPEVDGGNRAATQRKAA